MMRTLIYYFSGSGNTMRIARLFAQELDAPVREIRLPFPDVTDLSSYDLVGIGYPVHAFNPPSPVVSFVKALPSSPKTRFFLFKTSGEDLHLNESSSRRLIAIMRRQGNIVTNEFHYLMPYDIMYRHSDAMAKQMYVTARGLVPLDARVLKDRVIAPPRYHFFQGWHVPLFRILTPFSRTHGTAFSVDQDKCLHCSSCLKNCPMNNITEENGTYVFHHDCCLCMRCTVNCPQDAIRPGIFNRHWKIGKGYDLDRLLADDSVVIPTHDYGSRFLAKSYERYFAKAQERIAKSH